jgi:hypothetical protein
MQTEPILITVFLNPTEAELFKKFQKHFTLVGLLDSVDALDIKNGSIRINFDHEGKIRSLDKQEHFIAQ